MDEESSVAFGESEGSFDSSFDDDFGQTVALLDMNAEEVLFEIQNSYEEVEGNKNFPCEFCQKICKSKGGRTKHQRSKHMAELGESVSTNAAPVTLEKTKSIIRDIARCLTDEKLYKPEQAAEVFKLEPSESFVGLLNDLLVKHKRKKSIDKFLKEFYGKTNANWQEYFRPYSDKKMVFLMLIHLPERLMKLIEEDKEPSDLR